MKRILTTTALVALTSLPLHAESHANAAGDMKGQVMAGDQEYRASDLMGATVYMPAEGDAANIDDMTMNEVPEGWTEIGTVEDIFVGEGGEVATVVMDPNDETATDRDKIGVEAASITFKKSEDGETVYVVYTGDAVTLQDAQEFDEAAVTGEGQMSASEMSLDDDKMADDAKADMTSDRDADMDRMADAAMEQNGLTIRAADLSGRAVYIPGDGVSADDIEDEMTDAADDWERVGEIGSVILSRDGQIKSITLDAGGFLGMGEKEVETSMDELRFVRDSDEDADDAYFVVYTGDPAKLEEQDIFDRDRAEEDGNWVMTPDYAEETRMDDDRETMRENDLTTAMDADQMAKLTADDLEGQTVYGSDGESIGEVDELVLGDQGEISEVVVDVGGFLGIGEKPVALPFSDLQISQDPDDMNAIKVSTRHTQEELEAMESWEEQ